MSKILYDGMGKPWRTFKLCGVCKSMSVDLVRLEPLNCGQRFVCKLCGAILVMADSERCGHCKFRIDCLTLPSVHFISEVEYFFPIKKEDETQDA